METKIACDSCGSPIPLGDVNVATDVALCRKCGKNSSYAALAERQADLAVDLENQPNGAWFRGHPKAFEAGVSTRHTNAFFLVPVFCFWSAISLGGAYGTQIVERHSSLGLSLFGLPFLFGALGLGAAALMAVAGKVTIKVGDDKGTVFTGVGPIGWRRGAPWGDITAIKGSYEVSPGRKSGHGRIVLEVGSKRRVSFGTGASLERLAFLTVALRRMLHERRF